MAHVHAGEDRTAYFMDQLCTIGFCGAIGVVQILLWHYDILKQILVPGFHIPVLISGISLTILALVRGTYLWLSVGAETGEQKQADCCDHDHGHVHEHDHQHEHGHDHEHQGAAAAQSSTFRERGARSAQI